MGTDDYMTKPIDEEEMLLRIKALLRRAKIANERKIVIGDVVLGYDSLTVSKSGEKQELPQKEFLLLYKLLSYVCLETDGRLQWVYTPTNPSRGISSC